MNLEYVVRAAACANASHHVNWAASVTTERAGISIGAPAISAG
jgi:hypothetical protein